MQQLLAEQAGAINFQSEMNENNLNHEADLINRRRLKMESDIN